jgi:SAM-dependent methyltransferase
MTSMDDKLTSKEDWEDYWSHHKPARIENTYLEEFIDGSPHEGSLIEIGGFPGTFAAYFKKRFNYHVSILDYVGDPEIVKQVEKYYRIEPGSIHSIHADFFDYESPDEYDIVMSVGFIEHFDNTELVIKKHVELVKPDGKLVITLPNFAGINGYVQKYYDPENYAKHNIKSMNINLLRDIMQRMDMDSFSVEYHGPPHIWLEPSAPVSSFTRFFLRCISKVMRGTKMLPWKKGKLLAPYIVIHGHK